MSRILLIAPTCDGTDVGEAWVAFQWASRLAVRHEVTLLTYHKRGRPTAASQLPGVRVIEWTEPPLVGRAERLNSLLKPGYFVFAARARHWIRRALAAGETFDVAHQPVPVAMRYPSPATGLGIPLVIGPVGGGLPDPPGFGEAGDTSPWYVRLRAFDRWRLRHDPLLRQTYRTAECVLGIAPYVADRLRDVPGRAFEVLSDTGLQELPPTTVHERDPHPLRLLHVGRLVRTKGARDTIRALGYIPRADVHLDVIGDGPDRPACEALARELDLTGRITFHGSLARATVDDFYRAADIFVFPSYREPGGSVVFEAMGLGLPLIVADRGGPASSVDESCAIRIPVTNPDALARDVATAIDMLISEPEVRLEMGRQSRKRVAEVGLWESKIDRVEGVYARAIATARADFGNSLPAAEHG